MVARTRKMPITIYISESRFAAGAIVERWKILAAIEKNIDRGAERSIAIIYHVMTELLEPKIPKAILISATWIASVSNQALMTARGQMHTHGSHDGHKRALSCRQVPPRERLVWSLEADSS